MGRLVHTLPQVAGVTSLAGEIYLVRYDTERDHVEVYDVITYSLQRRLTLPNAYSFTDITSCEHYRCVYIGEYSDECVHRLDVEGAVTQWPVNDSPDGLSVNASHNVLVTCPRVHIITEFSSHGERLRELTLPDDVIHPSHAIQTRTGQFIVCHGDDRVQRVCMISADGRHIVHSHGGRRGSDTGQYRVPCHLAVDDNEFVFVADHYNDRVTLLSPTLEYVRHVVSGDQLMGEHYRLYLDTQQRLLYVAVSELKDGKLVGRVEVFSV